MRRRTLLLSLMATGVASACAGRASSEIPALTPILGSTTASTLTPQSVTSFTPVPGSAPSRSFAVERRDLNFARGTDRPLPTRLWCPADGDGSYPLILFSHGLTSRPQDFDALLTRWAQAGFVVAGPTFPHTSYGAPKFDEGDIVNQPADVRYVLDQLLGDASTAAMIDRSRLAAAGHSGGGITTTGLFSAQRDPRLKAGMVIAGTDFQGTPFTGPPAAMLFVHGTADDTVAYQAGKTVYEAVPWSRAMLTVDGGGHVIESDSFEPITRTSTEFWRWSLYGDEPAKTRLAPAAKINGVATLENRL